MSRALQDTKLVTAPQVTIIDTGRESWTTIDPTALDTSSEEGLERLAAVAAQPTIERAVDCARELLDMDVAYATKFSEGHQVFQTMRGDGDSFGIHEGLEIPHEETYCRRILAGKLPGLIPDVRADPIAGEMTVTESSDVGCFASVPVRFADGNLYGTLCVASHHPRADLGERDTRFLAVFARMIADQVERELLVDQSRRSELKSATVGALAAALDARDHYTAMHSLAVVAHAAEVARRLGLDAGEVADVEHVAVLHDIGKIAVPDALLQKRGSLSAEEWEVMRRHPVHGERLVAEIDGLEHLAAAVRGEHERWDGAGYPDGLAGEEIPMASRIVFVCDAYDAMRTDRPDRQAMAEDAARAEIRAGLGSLFCPDGAQALLDVLAGAEVLASAEAPGVDARRR